MDLDIVRKIKSFHLKASFETLKLKHKFFLILFLLSLITTLIPHITYAQGTTAQDLGPALTFDTGNNDYQDYLDQLSQNLTDEYYQLQLQHEAARQAKLTQAVATYLREQDSPLAEVAGTLVTLRNWKKIVALSNAESSMCRHYPVATSNCWGVGGASLWNMGPNLNDGVIAMNHFLNNYPKHSSVKYSQMSFEQMNGLYKQPPAQHWVDNNYAAYNDLVRIENSIQ